MIETFQPHILASAYSEGKVGDLIRKNKKVLSELSKRKEEFPYSLGNDIKLLIRNPLSGNAIMPGSSIKGGHTLSLLRPMEGTGTRK